MSGYMRLNWVAVALLVVLRLTIGWHFYKEGSVKVQEGFSSEGFMSAAKGPYADFFREMVPDSLGIVRLNADRMNLMFEKLASDAGNHYRFDENQSNLAKQRMEEAKARLKELYEGYKPTIAEYLQGYERHLAMKRDKVRDDVASLRSQRTEIDAKWVGLARPILADIDRVIAGYENDLDAIASAEQRRAGGKLYLNLPSKGILPTRTVDKIIPIFDMSVGILLILGLLTPIAATLAGFFLVSVILTQYPGSEGAVPTYFQAVEAAACFFLAASDSGRYAGLDFIPWSWWAGRKKRRKRSSF